MDELRKEVSQLREQVASLLAIVRMHTTRIDALQNTSFTPVGRECHHIFSRGPYFDVSGNGYYQCELCGKRERA